MADPVIAQFFEHGRLLSVAALLCIVPINAEREERVAFRFASARRVRGAGLDDSLVLEPDGAAPLAGHDDVQVAVAVEIRRAEVDARADAFAVGDDVLGPNGQRCAAELVVIDPERSGLIGVAAVVGHEPFAGNQLGHAAAVEVGQHEAVGLRPRLVNQVLLERDLISLANLLVPEDAIPVGGGSDDVVETIAVHVIDENLRGVVHLAIQPAEGQGMLDPRAVARVSRGLEPGVGPNEVRAAIAIEVANSDTPGHGLLRNDVFGEGALARPLP